MRSYKVYFYGEKKGNLSQNFHQLILRGALYLMILIIVLYYKIFSHTEARLGFHLLAFHAKGLHLEDE